MAGFWSDLGGMLVGKPAGEFDPHERDRKLREQALIGAMGQYDQMMAQPNGFIPKAYQDQMRQDVTNQVQNQYAGQGQSGFTNDRIARAQNDLSMKMLGTNLDQANKQRDYMEKLTMMNQPTQYQPQQVGLLGQIGGNLASGAIKTGVNAASNYFGSGPIYGPQAQDSWSDPEEARRRNQGGNQGGMGGMSVGSYNG